jgi:tRNA (guanine37-N1)-methyltransferase
MTATTTTELETLDRTSIKEELSLVALKTFVPDIALALKEFKDILLNRSGFRNVADLPSNQAQTDAGQEKPSKLILLSEKIKTTDLGSWSGTEAERLKVWLENHKGELVKHVLSLTYTNYTYEEVLQRILPSGVEIPSSFETIGHVAHLNLRDAHLPFKFLIAQVMLDKYGAIKTVINKIGKEVSACNAPSQSCAEFTFMLYSCCSRTRLIQTAWKHPASPLPRLLIR